VVAIDFTTIVISIIDSCRLSHNYEQKQKRFFGFKEWNTRSSCVIWKHKYKLKRGRA
jgi:hypothetical protein